jgi:hypothetical protein
VDQFSGSGHDGHFVAAHWRASDKSYGYDGYNVRHALSQRPELQPCVHHDDENFVLDMLRRTSSQQGER